MHYRGQWKSSNFELIAFVYRRFPEIFNYTDKRKEKNARTISGKQTKFCRNMKLFMRMTMTQSFVIVVIAELSGFHVIAASFAPIPKWFCDFMIQFDAITSYGRTK